MPMDFTSILRGALLRQMTHKATCQTCKQFAYFSTRRSIPSSDLPPILAINTCAYNEETLAFWLDTRAGTFLTPRVDLHGQIDGIDDPEPAQYELRVGWPAPLSSCKADTNQGCSSTNRDKGKTAAPCGNCEGYVQRILPC